MKEIILTQGKVALVDDEDYEELIKYKWYAWRSQKSRTFYARRCDGMYKKVYMHRQILGLNKTRRQGEHIDHNGLNNTRSNLRISTQAQNVYNLPHRVKSSSPYKGVSINKLNKNWRVQIKKEGKKVFDGSFKTAEEAALAYNEQAVKIFGEFAYLNVI